MLAGICREPRIALFIRELFLTTSTDMADGAVSIALSLSGAELAGLMEAVLARGVSFRFQAKGSSMSPLIRDGDILTVAPLGERRARLGQVLAVVQPSSGKLLVHRVVARRHDTVLIQGDAVSQPDGWVPAASVLGWVSRVERQDRRIRLGLGWERLIIVLFDRYGLWPYIHALVRGVRRLRP